MIKLLLRFHPNEIYFPTDNFYSNVSNTVYYNYEDYEYFGKVYNSITYEIYYKYNGAIGCGYSLFPKSEKLGFHHLDAERIKILLDENEKPLFVYFSAHSDEGKWYKWEECEIINDNILTVYIARASHANYHKSGTWLRIFGLANDKCSKKGPIIIPELKRDSYLSYKPENKEKCHSLWKRLLLPFFLKK